MSIVLNQELERRVTARLQSGRYRSADQVIEEGLDLLEARDTERAPVALDERPIWEVIAEISRSVPEEAWDDLPSDLSKNLDHYLYGAPKVSE